MADIEPNAQLILGLIKYLTAIEGQSLPPELGGGTRQKGLPPRSP